ncbi:MAG TPA: flagellar hook protein FlgE, partial [Terriglobales bacterium]|nr:flagellar hook protein FlgE [Terriglobales bacterium]
MPLFSIPLSGLSAASEALSVISNNLANLNTDSYKDQNVSFQDLFYQQLGTSGSGDPMQTGNGVTTAAISSNFTDGGLDTTSVPTDMAITGNGFFVTQQNGVTQYTRDGNFTTNSSGQLVTQDGQLVMAYPVVGGVVSSTSAVGPLNVSQSVTNPPSATTSFALNTNLNASANAGDSSSTPLTVYDSLGNSHILTFQFTKTGSNGWNYSATLPGADTGSPNPTVVTSGSLTFDGNGNLTSPTSNVTGISVTGLADGASAMTMTWSLFGSNGSSNLTQLATTSAPSTTSQNGFPAGALQSFTVDSSGVVEGVFSSGQSRQIGQVALASFANDQGLQRVGDNNYVATLASGEASVGAPGSGGRGTITGGALELSNVDVATEFAKMIVAQRSYEANAKVVTTFDQVAQD